MARIAPDHSIRDLDAKATLTYAKYKRLGVNGRKPQLREFLRSFHHISSRYWLVSSDPYSHLRLSLTFVVQPDFFYIRKFINDFHLRPTHSLHDYSIVLFHLTPTTYPSVKMRSSAIVAFVTLAAVTPALAAPVVGPAFTSNARRATTSSTTPPPSSAPVDESGALSLGTIGTIFSLGAPIISGIIDHFKNGDQQQRRQAEELESLFARADVDESGALKLPSLGTIGTIFGLGAPVISGIIDHFENNGQQQQARELEKLLARADTDESDALSLGTIGTIFSLGAPIVSGIIDHFKGNDNQSREFMELLARAEVDESGALKLGDAASIASIGSSLVSAFHNLFGG